MLTVDISGLPAEVRRELCEGRLHRKVQDQEDAAFRQRRIAAETGEHRSMDDIGRVRMNLDPTVFHYWGQRLGYQCWRDKRFLHEFERDNPEVRVKCGGTRIQVNVLDNVPKRTRIKTYGGSLIELLAVIAVLGVLGGLMLPTLKYSRRIKEAARNLNAFNQTRIALFLEDDFERLPPGVLERTQEFFASVGSPKHVLSAR